MNREIRPAGVAPAAANYALGVVTDAPSRWLHTSGIVPVRPDGSVPPRIEEQADVVWATMLALLDEASLTIHDVVSVTTYVVVGEMGHLGAVMAARDRALQGRRSASTLVTVPALARPEWLIEIAVVAAR